MISLKLKSFGAKENFPLYLLVLLGILSAFLLKWVAFPVMLVAYVLVSLLFKNKPA
jgi:CDP-diacylglycerol--serine O-phosphatidyltransferase